MKVSSYTGDRYKNVKTDILLFNFAFNFQQISHFELRKNLAERGRYIDPINAQSIMINSLET